MMASTVNIRQPPGGMNKPIFNLFSMKIISVRPIYENETYADMIRVVLNFQHPGMGFTIEQMQKRLKILDKLDQLIIKESDSTELHLEDEEAKELLRALDLMDGNWGRVDAEIVEFVASIKKDVA